MIKVIFVPGNGGSTTNDNWFPSVKSKLESEGLEVIAAQFPDSILARKSYWLPFLRDTLKVDENTILVGHSSGAIAALCFAQEQMILGSVLVGAYHTDLGIEAEKQSGYFDEEWNWQKIKSNQRWTILFSSQDDPWIPIDEPRYIYTKLQCEYHEYKNQGHFGGDYYKETFPELSSSIIRNIKKSL